MPKWEKVGSMPSVCQSAGVSQPQSRPHAGPDGFFHPDLRSLIGVTPHTQDPHERRTDSGIEILPVYRPDVLEGWDPEIKLGEPGSYPYTRGVHPEMYRSKLWTMRLFAGFGTAEDTNVRFRELLRAGSGGLSVAFDLPTLMGYDADDPFAAADRILDQLPDNVRVCVCDMHAETTSEKGAMGHWLDGRVSLVFGTHTHIPTADERILHNGTAYQTDVGMSGPFDSVIGVERELVLHRFLTGMPGKFEAAKGNPKMCATLIACDGGTGRASAIQRIMLGE